MSERDPSCRPLQTAVPGIALGRAATVGVQCESAPEAPDLEMETDFALPSDRRSCCVIQHRLTGRFFVRGLRGSRKRRAGPWPPPEWFARKEGEGKDVAVICRELQVSEQTD